MAATRKRPRSSASSSSRSSCTRRRRSLGLKALAALALAALAPLSGASDIPTDAYFTYDGQHSDLAQQFYALSLDPELSDTVAQLSIVKAADLPSDVDSALTTASLGWEDLPGLLQRAILWDYGYALSAAGQLAKVYTRCGRSMAEIFVPLKAVQRVGCDTSPCNYDTSSSSSSSSSSNETAYRSGSCDVDALTRIALCAVDDSAVSPPSYSAVWGDGGTNDSVPLVSAQRHVWATSASTPEALMFALHTIADEVALGQCPSTPAMVIPCAALKSVNSSRFCSPERGDVLPAWLTKYAADHKEDKTWLLVPLCIVTFVSVGVVAVYRYKAALRDQNQQLVDQFMRENRHLFDNGSVEAFLVSRHSSDDDDDDDDEADGKMDAAARRYVRFQRKRRWKRKNRRPPKLRRGSSASLSSGGASSDDESSPRSGEEDASVDGGGENRGGDGGESDEELDVLESGQHQSRRHRGPGEGVLNAAAFEYFDAAIGLSASAFDPLSSSARVQPLRTPHADAAMARMLRSSRRNELAIRSFRLFESHKKIRRLRIQLKELQPVRLLSTGSTGEVWLAMHGSKQVAIKQLVPAKRRVLREMEMFLAEIYLLAQLKHRCIVPLIGIAWNTLEHVVMVQQYMESGDLQHYLAAQRPTKPAPPTLPHKESVSLSSNSSSHHSISIPNSTKNNSIEAFVAENRSFTWSKHRLQIAQAVASALAYMHALTPKLLHRDVKSRNVLLNAHMEAKLCDFGISRRKFQQEDDAETNNNLSVAGTMAWTAPELLLGEAYSEKVDIYSFGVLLAELDSCLLPYHDSESLSMRLVQHPLRLLKKIVNEGARPRLTADCPPKIAQLYHACVHRDPRMRPSAGEVVALLASAAPPERGLLSRKSSSFATY